MMNNFISNKDWLSNSTFKHSSLDEFENEEKKLKDNEILASGSDSDKTYFTIHKRKKHKHKKLKKKNIIMHYISSLPSITDENSEFRKYNFLEHMPKENRSKNYFVDLKGNSQISRYGSIYEKHISKYRLSDHNKKVKKSDRYYEKLKSVFQGTAGKNISIIEKRLCDSHCICRQSFIPIPFDTPYQHESKFSDGKNKIIDSVESATVVSVLNETVNREPHNVAAWLQLIKLQAEEGMKMPLTGLSNNSIVIDRQLMIVERALTKNQSCLRLHLVRMELGRHNWPPEKLHREWNQLLFVYSTDIDLWKIYIDHATHGQSVGFSIDRVISIYIRCFSTFFNAMSGRTKTKNVDAESVFGLCDLFSDFCDYLSHSGYSERAFASWQAMIEYNFCTPPSLQPKSSGNLLDDPMLQSFQDFWQSSSIIGHPDARGWNKFFHDKTSTTSSSSIRSSLESPLQASLQKSVSDIENSLLIGDDDECQMWLKLEDVRQRSWWLPLHSSETDQEDPDRCVSFQLVQPVLITLHNPQNISSSLPSSLIAQKARRQLLLLFFDFIGVSYARLSLQEQLSIYRVHWHQLVQLSSINNLTGPVTQVRNQSHQFIQCCINQLKDVLDSDWSQTISMLELSFRIKSSLDSHGDSWKHALSAIKNSAKTILVVNADDTLLWVTYADLLLGLVNHDLFSKSDKARSTLLNEASKVVQPLVQRVTSCSLPLHHKLHILALSIDLVTRKHVLDSSDAVIKTIVSIISPAAHIFAALFTLSPPTDKSIDSLMKTFSEVVGLINGTPESLTPCWFQAVHFQIISQLLCLDLEKFQEWMIEECLLTITSTGSSCLWSQEFLYQFSQLLESSLSFIGWFYFSRSRNECAILRSLLTPIIHVLVKIQTGVKKPILEMVISPKLILNCIGTSSISQGQRFKLRNFLWNLIGSFETEIEMRFNRICQASTILLLNMEIERLNSLKTTEFGIFSGRIERVRSTVNRIFDLQCMHWKYRLIIWHSLLTLESSQQTNKRDDMTKGVFYRAVTEMPGQKSLYLAIVSLVPSMLEETTLLMKNNHVRICAPLEEIKLLTRIRQSNNQSSSTLADILPMETESK